ncbi:MAG: 6-phosphofructokinase [Deltaproteobacteria bacterium]|nr:6-phosphofructokinase [Deltaproteobacteria bacterium]
MKPIAILTSGGDAPGMNTAIRSVVKLCAREGISVLGVKHGYEGLMQGRFTELTPLEVDAIGGVGGTLLGSARSVAFTTPEGRARAGAKLAGTEGLIVIGGNGSLTGALKLAQETGTQVIGIPASIDNDIGCTATAIGVDTALNTIVDACDRISDTARAHRRAFIVEVMGRQCGYLAMASSVGASADACLYRESGKDEDSLVAELRELMLRSFAPERGKQRVLVIKAEGVTVPTSRLVSRLQEHVDRDLPGVEVRGTVLGHLVRGGSPSYQDRMVAGRLAVAAVQALLSGHSPEMVAWQPWNPGGTPTRDASVHRFSLEQVIEETTALLDGTSPVTQRRVKLMQSYAGVLAI